MKRLVDSPLNINQLLGGHNRPKNRIKVSKKKIEKNLQYLPTGIFRQQHKEQIGAKYLQSINRMELERPHMINQKKDVISRV